MIVVAAVVVAVVGIFAIAAVAVGRETFTLATQPRQSLFDIEEAVAWVGEQLPESVTSRVTYDDVREVVLWQLDYLVSRRVPVRRDRVAGRRVFVEDEESVAFVLERVEAYEMDLTDDDVAAVIDATMAYLVGIGAVGRALTEPEVAELNAAPRREALGTGGQAAVRPMEPPADDAQSPEEL
jgi:hypothetical protein